MNKIITAAEMAEHYAPLVDLHGALMKIEDRIAALKERETICWDMAGVFLHARDAHGLHDMGVEIQGIQWAIRELEQLP